MKAITVVTTSRADYGIYQPVLRAIAAEPAMRLRLIVGGAHLRPEFGGTLRDIESDGYAIAARVDMLDGDDSPAGIAASMGRALAGFAAVFASEKPDLLVILGDRFEMHAAALAALPFKIPVAHIHGGELTFGAIDDALRHSITKLSHLHFAATAGAARRLVQLGEEPWRITTTGAPALDHLGTLAIPTRGTLASRLGIPLDPPPLLVTFHPVTLEYEHTASHTAGLLAALREVALPVIFTMPNADTHGRVIAEAIRKFVASTPSARLVENAGTENYFGLMSCCAAMVGNSSSGIIEAASFRLPVVNIGRRQAGREHGANVQNCPPDAGAIAAAIRRAASREFRESLATLVNPYGDGNAAARIVARLKDAPPAATLVAKRFHDLQQ